MGPEPFDEVSNCGISKLRYLAAIPVGFDIRTQHRCRDGGSAIRAVGWQYVVGPTEQRLYITMDAGRLIDARSTR